MGECHYSEVEGGKAPNDSAKYMFKCIQSANPSLQLLLSMSVRGCKNTIKSCHFPIFKMENGALLSKIINFATVKNNLLYFVWHLIKNFICEKAWIFT